MIDHTNMHFNSNTAIASTVCVSCGKMVKKVMQWVDCYVYWCGMWCVFEMFTEALLLLYWHLCCSELLTCLMAHF